MTALSAVNPRLIYCSITGFGQDGPRRDQAAYDFMIQGMCGLMSVTGEADGKPGGGPQKVGVPIVDIMTGMYAAIAVLAALARRDESGQGEYIDIGMLDVGVSFLANQAMNYLVSGKPPRRSGNAHPNIQPQDVFRARDGYLVLAVGNDDQFARFCEVIGRPDLAQDERFRTNAGARAQQRDADADPGRGARDAAIATTGSKAARAPACRAGRSTPSRRRSPTRRSSIAACGSTFAHPVAGTVPQVASPMRFRNAPLSHDRAPPLLGEHTEEILRELGWTTRPLVRKGCLLGAPLAPLWPGIARRRTVSLRSAYSRHPRLARLWQKDVDARHKAAAKPEETTCRAFRFSPPTR